MMLPSDSTRDEMHRTRFVKLLEAAATPRSDTTMSFASMGDITTVTSDASVIYCDPVSQSYYDPLREPFAISRWPSMFPRDDEWTPKKLKARWKKLMLKAKAEGQSHAE